MSEEIKYEAVFGDQSLFDGAPNDAEGVFLSFGNNAKPAFYRLQPFHEYFFGGEWVSVGSISSQTFSAMRRIIKTPVWTKEDQKAGRLPEVGARFFEEGYGEDEVIKIIDNAVVALRPNNHGAVSISKPLFFKYGSINPIETPEERAQRLEDEFVTSLCKELDGTSLQHDSIYERGVRAAYRRLSGELQAPTKGE